MVKSGAGVPTESAIVMGRMEVKAQNDLRGGIGTRRGVVVKHGCASGAGLHWILRKAVRLLVRFLVLPLTGYIHRLTEIPSTQAGDLE